MPLWIILTYSLISALCIYSVIRLFRSEKKSYAKAALSTYIFYMVVFFSVWIVRISVPSYILFLAMLTVLGACFFGHFLGCYTKSKTFDRYLHAFGAFSFSLLTYCVLDDFVDIGGSLAFRAIFIFLIGNTLGVLFELIEMCHDRKNKQEPKSQKGLRDTDMALLFNLIGSILSGAFAYFFLLK